MALVVQQMTGVANINEYCFPNNQTLKTPLIVLKNKGIDSLSL